MSLKIYLFIRGTDRERQRHRQREKQAPSREPDVGLDLGTLGSHPELKADTQPLSHPGIHPDGQPPDGGRSDRILGAQFGCGCYVNT